MDTTKMLNDYRDAARAIIATAETEGRDLTDAEQAAFDEQVAAYEGLKSRVDQAAANSRRLAALNEAAPADDDGDGDGGPVGGAASGTKAGGSLGQRFVAGAGYQRLATKAREMGGLGRNQNISIEPTAVGSMGDWWLGRKAALGTELGHLQPVRMPLVDQVSRPELTLLDLISRGTTSGSFEYLQVTAINRATAIVPENTGDDTTDKRKPESSFTTQLETAKVYDYADGYTVTNQLLADDKALASFLDAEFRYSFDAILADKLLNGTGTNGEPRGLLNTTGVQQQSYTVASGASAALALVTAVRQSITKLRKVGAGITAVLVSPEDAEAIDLMRDGNERFYGQGPFGIGPATLWGRPLVESEQLEPGTCIVGDFRQIALLDRSGLSVQAFNQHKDYAARNLTYVRAELRAAQAVWRPGHLAVVAKA